MKFDMSKAWNDAMAMLSANRDLLIIVAAVFLFLPSLALSVLAPGTEIEQAASDPAQFQAALSGYFMANWPLFLAYAIASTIGTLTLLALLGRNERLTVGEALSVGLKAFLPYIVASLLLGFGLGLVAMLIGVVGAITGPAIGLLLALAMLIGIAFVMFRLVLVGPVMAIEGILNPITAIQRSWQLVKGNTRFVALFLILLMVAMIVMAMVLSLIFGLLGALASSGTVALWITGTLSGIMGAAMSLVFLAVYAAIHRQLAGGNTDVSETFE